MKKLVFVLTALLCAQTLAAGVDIWCEHEGSGVVAVHYQADSDANLPRGFGLNIALDNDANITAVSDFADGSNDGKNQYWVYPGQIVIVDNDVCEVNTPLASAVDTNSIIVEMGSLHWPTAANSPNAPATSGVLCKFTVDGDCTVTISGNTARGNVVLYDATAADTNLPSSCSVALAQDCMMASHPDYTYWVLFDKPDSWCYKYQCRGDADGLAEGPFWVSLDDLIELRQWIDFFDPMDPNPLGSASANFDHDKEGPFWVSLNDLIILRQWIDYFDPMTPIPECNDVHINEWLTP